MIGTVLQVCNAGAFLLVTVEIGEGGETLRVLEPYE